MNDSVMEVSPGTPDQAAMDRKKIKRPFKCPACAAFYREAGTLRKHLIEMHIQQELWRLPRKLYTPNKLYWRCAEKTCGVVRISKTEVIHHMTANHEIVADIIRMQFPSFGIPIEPIVIDLDKTGDSEDEHEERDAMSDPR